MAGFGVTTEDEAADLCENVDHTTTYKGFNVVRYWSVFDKNCQPRLDPPPESINETWILGGGTPLIEFTGDVHEVHLDVPASRVVTDATVTQVLLVIQTGGDDLRGGTDNADVTLHFAEGSTSTVNVNSSRQWNNGETHSVVLNLPSPAPRVRDIAGLTITTHFGGGLSGDNWKVDKVALIVSWPVGSVVQAPATPVLHDWLDASSAPLWRFTASQNDGTVLKLSPWPRPDPGIRIRALDLILYTGNDDLRHDSQLDINVRANTHNSNGSYGIFLPNVNAGRAWDNWTVLTIPIPIPPTGLMSDDFDGIDLIDRVGFSFPATYDNWNLNRLRLVATLSPPRSSMYISQAVPGTMVLGQRYPVSVTFANTGSATWTIADQYRLGSQNPQANDIWHTSGRIPLPGNVAPGSSVTFNYWITAPSSPGTYNFQWKMVQDGVEWFGDTTPNVAVTVSGQMTAQLQPVPPEVLRPVTFTVAVRDAITGLPVPATIEIVRETQTVDTFAANQAVSRKLCYQVRNASDRTWDDFCDGIRVRAPGYGSVDIQQWRQTTGLGGVE